MNKENNGEHKLLASFIVGDAALGILFIILRILGFVDWPWKWVTCPFWAPLMAFCVLVLTVSVWTAVSMLIGHEDENNDDDMP